MSDAMGPLTFGKNEEQIFLGREIAQHQDYSEDTALKIDQEVKRFVTDNYERAHELLIRTASRRCIKIADALLAREVLDADQVSASRPACRSKSRGRPPRGRAVVDEEPQPRQKERAPIVPSLNKPLPQE